MPIPQEARGFLRDLSLLLGVPFLALALLIVWWHPWPSVYDVPPPSDIFQVASGEWDWANDDCVTNPHTISFSADHRVMTLSYRQGTLDSLRATRRAYEYDIAEVSRHHIRGRIRGETRQTPGGEPVVWDLVLQSPNVYYWHRADQPFFDVTTPVRRCRS
ncbi:MAG TPA: hypothetical protein VJQ44_14240 [Gemmatimonadales bacterium]|nr:hypothetical protein [Gemmatimonadales bacterium]